MDMFNRHSRFINQQQKCGRILIAFLCCFFIASCQEQPDIFSETVEKNTAPDVASGANTKLLENSLEYHFLDSVINKQRPVAGSSLTSLWAKIQEQKSGTYDQRSVNTCFEPFKIVFLKGKKGRDSIGESTSRIEIRDSNVYYALLSLHKGTLTFNNSLVEDTISPQPAPNNPLQPPPYYYGYQITIIILLALLITGLAVSFSFYYKKQQQDKLAIVTSIDKLRALIEGKEKMNEDTLRPEIEQKLAALTCSLEAAPQIISERIQQALNKLLEHTPRHTAQLAIQDVPGKKYYAYPQNGVFQQMKQQGAYDAFWIVDERTMTYEINQDNILKALNNIDYYISDTVAEIANYKDVSSPTRIITERKGQVKPVADGWKIVDKTCIRLEK